ncbi:MAG: HNH endonuclease signature motif containing protein [Chloroflexota bacterium]
MSFQEAFRRCIFRKHNESDFKNIESILQACVDNYESNAEIKSLHEILPLDENSIIPITNNNLKKLYSDDLQKKDDPRKIYDDLLASAKYGKCVYCSYGESVELDHLLPKSKFPEFSILPYNLVPSCRRCNALKLDYIPSNNRVGFVHPYYEDYSQIEWLYARPIFTNNFLNVEFYVDDPLNLISAESLARLRFQFTKLNLNIRYSGQVASEISDIYYSLNNHFNKGGSYDVHTYLLSEAESARKSNLNSLKTALFTCMANSMRVCDMDWEI